MRSTSRVAAGMCLLAVVGTLAEVGAVAAGDRVDTSSLVADRCANGSPNCVKVTIRQMRQRFEPLAESCSHQAIFSLTYLRTTQKYAEVAAEPNYFQDVRFVNHEDAVFADYYFEAYDDWAAGRDAQVPRAWKVALDAAEQRKVSGSGNLLLGMNAHVNRDLPFVLAELGLGSKADHDKVNEFLAEVAGPLLAELSRRFDPTMDDSDDGYGLTRGVLLEFLFTWREVAWLHAGQLHSAPTPGLRALVAKRIEAYASEVALDLKATYRYKDLGASARTRDAYCATHG